MGYKLTDFTLVERLYPYRFGLFLLSLCFILFGGLLMPFGIFEEVFLPIANVVNLIAGMLVISNNKIQKRSLFTWPNGFR